MREHGGITAVSAAQRDAINASHAQTIATLADDLIGRNANEALDYPIAIAAANQSATAGVRDAWQNVSNLQARAAETFAGTGPGGWGMMIAGYMGGLDEWGQIFAGGWTGVGHGFAMMGNAFTFHQIDSLDSYVDGLIEDNGGAYGAANFSAHVGVYAAELAGAYFAITFATAGGTAVIGNSTVIGNGARTFHAWLSANRAVWSTGQNYAWIQSIIQSRMVVRLAQPFTVTNTAASTTGLWTTWEVGLLQQAVYVLFFHWWLPPLL